MKIFSFKRSKLRLYQISLILYMILLLPTGCNNSDKSSYVKSFKSNQVKFNELIDYLNNKFILNISNSSQQRMIFLNCNKYPQTISEEICDPKVIELMEDLDLRKINIEKDNCDSTHKFGKVFFMVSKQKYYPIIQYVYDYCNKSIDYESETIYHKSMTENWSILIDSNFP